MVEKCRSEEIEIAGQQLPPQLCLTLVVQQSSQIFTYTTAISHISQQKRLGDMERPFPQRYLQLYDSEDALLVAAWLPDDPGGGCARACVDADRFAAPRPYPGHQADH
jgi:hypothetical protein